jgi:hypothetical protein
MNPRLGVAFLVTALVLAGVCVVQQRQLARLRAQVESLRSAESAPTDTSVSPRTPVGRPPHSPSADSTVVDVAPATPVIEAQTAPAPVGAEEAKGKGGMGNMLARMMEDPGMRKMMLDQQRVVMNTMYEPLFKEMNLTNEEKEKLTQLMLDNAMKGVERARDLFSGGDPAKRDEATQSLGEELKQSQAEIKELLGEERFAQYEDYTRNMGNRMAVDQLKSQLASGATPLQDTQAQQLLQIMREEHEMGSDSSGFAGGASNDPSQTLNAIASEEAMDQLFQKQEEINKRVADRATTVLTAEQSEALRTQQANQLNLQRMGMKMARQMMGGAGDTQPAQPAPAPAR